MSQSKDANSGRGGPAAGVQDDFVVMEQIARGDAGALGRLYDRYGTVVHSLCLRVVRDAGAAEEVMIDVFHEVWTRAERYSPGRGTPVAYLLTLARSRALDRARVRARAGQGGTVGIYDSAAARKAPDRGAGPLAEAVADERRSLIRRVLGRLDPKYREVLECSYFEGLSHSEIALKLGKPVGTVKTYLRRGLIQLRDFIRNPGEEGGGHEGLAALEDDDQDDRKRDQPRGADAANAPG